MLTILNSKREVDEAIKGTKDRLLVLRFGRTGDIGTMELDEVLYKCERPLLRMAVIRTVEADAMPVYTRYFDVTLVPSLIFFFNGRHLKCDYGTQDHTKWVGPFRDKQDFLDLVEVFYTAAIHGKVTCTSPIDKSRVPKYELVYRDI